MSYTIMVGEVLALVGSPEATLMACRDVAAVRRNTHLAERIRRCARGV